MRVKIAQCGELKEKQRRIVFDFNATDLNLILSVRE